MRAHHEELLKDTLCRLPKHLGENWWSVLRRDRKYVEWVVENIEDLDEELRGSLEYGLEHF
jgi:hypothetical protein